LYLKGIEKLLLPFWDFEKYSFMQLSTSLLWVLFFFILSAINLKTFLMQYFVISYLVFLSFLNFPIRLPRTMLRSYPSPQREAPFSRSSCSGCALF
jgi:hypothetical protein